MDLQARLVSVVIPCYNHAAYLDDTIRSALNQTYSPIEIIVVDDGSTDESAAVAGRYPVRLLRQSNAGVATALNAGIRVSKGGFLSTLGSDDIMDTEYIQTCMR